MVALQHWWLETKALGLEKLRVTGNKLKRVVVVPEIWLISGDKDKKRAVCTVRSDRQPQLTPTCPHPFMEDHSRGDRTV